MYSTVLYDLGVKNYRKSEECYVHVESNKYLKIIENSYD
jgi:hypothetical protein